jgi:hypothetical protein
MNMRFSEMELIPGKLLEERLSEVRILDETETQRYAIVKDTETEEHLLQYSYIHRNLAGGGAEELYHYLMPLTSDDVMDVLFADKPYRYPDAWDRRFLRNGPDDRFVWFDPTPTFATDEDEAFAAELKEKLLRFKRKGDFDPESVDQLLRDLDKDH